MKNLSSSPSWDDTPRTNALVYELQSRPIPFEVAYWQLLELTRKLEFETAKLKKARLKKASGVVKSSQRNSSAAAKSGQRKVSAAAKSSRGKSAIKSVSKR